MSNEDVQIGVITNRILVNTIKKKRKLVWTYYERKVIYLENTMEGDERQDEGRGWTWWSTLKEEDVQVTMEQTHYITRCR